MKRPGQDTRYWKANAIYNEKCPRCGTSVEFFKDDIKRKCSKCEYMFLNPFMDLECASYCEQAKKCIENIQQINLVA